jgi:hypothetical protein
MQAVGTLSPEYFGILGYRNADQGSGINGVYPIHPTQPLIHFTPLF